MGDSARYIDFIERALEQLSHIESGIDLHVHKTLLEEASQLLQSTSLQPEEKQTCDQVFQGLGGNEALEALKEALQTSVHDGGVQVESEPQILPKITPSATSSVTPQALLLPLVQRTCEAKYEGKMYPGKIKNIKKTPLGVLRIEIEFFGYQGSYTYDSNDVILLIHPEARTLTKNLFCESIDEEDGIWKTILIEENKYLTQDPPTDEQGGIAYDKALISVSFVETGHVRDVRLDRIRMRPAIAPGTEQQKSGEKKNKEIVTPAGYVLPERLLIKANDSENTKMIKKTKIQNLKKAQLEKKIDDSYRVSQTSWKEFATKKKK